MTIPPAKHIMVWKRNIGVDVAFNHRSYIGGDLLRLQAGAEVKDVIKVGVYICPTKAFAKQVSPKDASSMVCYERTRWYLENFSEYPKERKAIIPYLY